jgi:predicted nucleic acid-binding protein
MEAGLTVPMLIDSDVLVWLTCGHEGAAKRLHAVEARRISTATYIELAQGCRDKADLARLKKGLAARNTDILPITPAISKRAADLIDQLALSHGMRLADAFIAATAIEFQATLITANVKHFSPIKDLSIEAFMP